MLDQLALASIRVLDESSVIDINPDDVTPGVIGFVFTALFAVAVILLGLDMYRRVRRMQYRAEVQEEIEAELAAQETPEAEDPESPQVER